MHDWTDADVRTLPLLFSLATYLSFCSHLARLVSHVPSELVCVCVFVCVCVCVGGGAACFFCQSLLICLTADPNQERDREREKETAGGGEWKRQRDEEWVFKDEDPVDISWNWREVVRRKTQGFALFHKQLRWRGHGDLKTTWNIYFFISFINGWCD